MRKFQLLKVVGVLCLTVALGLVFAGCSEENAEEVDQQTLNREYMASVNQLMGDLQTQLEDFSSAVAQGDVVTMRTQADQAFKYLDDLEALEVPEGLTLVHQDYVDGAVALESALTAYMDLFTQIETATEAQPFDWTQFDSRVAEIQGLYDEGIEKFEAGDNAAAEMN